MNYLILIIILVALYYFVIDVLLVSAYEKPLHKRMDEKNRWKNNILKIEKLTFRDHELYICICSQKIFYSYVDHIKICLESKSNDFFEIKEKTGLEKLLIKLGFLKTFKTGSSTFDDLLYIASDNAKLHQLLSNPFIQTKLIDTFTKKSHYKHYKLELYNRENEFCIEFSYKIHFSLGKKYKLNDIHINKILDQYGEIFLTIYHDLKLNEINTKNFFGERHEKVRMLKNLLKFNGIVSLVLVFYNSFFAFPKTLDLFLLYKISLIPSVIVSVIVIFYVAKKFQNSSFRLSSALKYAIASFLSVYVIFIYGLRYLNCTIDNSRQKEKIFYRTIVGKKMHVKSHEPYLKFDYKYTHTITGSELRVPLELYNNKKIGDNVSIHIKDGYFGIHYIETAY